MRINLFLFLIFLIGSHHWSLFFLILKYCYCFWKRYNVCTYSNCAHLHISYIHLMVSKHLYNRDYIINYNIIDYKSEKMYRQLFKIEKKICGQETKIHWTAYVGSETTCVRIARLRSKESRKWRDGLCDLSSWANPEYPYYRIENGPPRRSVLPMPRSLCTMYNTTKSVPPDSKMRRSNILSLLQKGKQDRKWADYRARARAISPATGWMHEKEFILENSFLRTITPSDRALLPLNCFSNGKLLKSNIISEFANVRL